MNLDQYKDQKILIKKFILSYMDRKKEAKEELTELDLVFLASLIKSLE